MKLYTDILCKGTITLSEGETTLCSFLEEDAICRELTIPDGIDTICTDALVRFPRLRVLHLPASVRSLAGGLFRMQQERHIRVCYAGSSSDFIALAKPTVEQEYVPGPYDHYPYYSDHGATYRDVVVAFDADCEDIEVYCEADGVYLYYGKRNKDPADEMPLSREEFLKQQEVERQKKLRLYARVLEYFRAAGIVSLACCGEKPHISPCFGLFDLYEDHVYLLFGSGAHLYPYIGRQPCVSVQAIKGERWIEVCATAHLEERWEAKAALAARLGVANDDTYDFFYLDEVSVLESGSEGPIGWW